MGKKRLGLHLVTILAIALFAFLAMSSAASTPAVGGVGSSIETVVSSTTTSRGLVHDMSDPNNKNYDTLGLVFASSVTKFDEKGLEISSQEGIITKLLKEAQKLGGEDILNLRVDENISYIQTTIENAASSSSSSSGSSTKKTTVVTTKTVTYTGSALAIKYRN